MLHEELFCDWTLPAWGYTLSESPMARFFHKYENKYYHIKDLAQNEFIISL